MTKYYLKVPFESEKDIDDVKPQINHDENSKTTTIILNENGKTTTIILEDSDIDSDAIIVSERDTRTRVFRVSSIREEQPVTMGG